MARKTIDQLLRENQDLDRRLEEAEDALRILRAIRGGEVDAVFVEAGREQVYTLETTDNPYRLLVEQIPYGAATLTTEGAIIYCNFRFCELLRQPLHLLLGKPIPNFVLPDSRRQLATLLHDARSAEVRGEVTLQRPDGTPVPVYLGISTVQEGVRGACLLITDLTEQRHYQELQRTQEALRASEERLNLAQRAGSIGTFEWNIRTGAVNWSATMEQLHELPAGGFGGRYEDWKQAVHPDDWDRIEADTRRAVAEGTELNTEFRSVRSDGETRWIACKGKVFYDDGEPLHMLGACLDITERKRIEKDLRDADHKKNEFLATLAHELRNPLAPVRNALHILRTSRVEEQAVERMYEMMERQVTQLVQLVDDLMEISRITSGKIELRKGRVQLATVVRDAVEASKPLIERAGHRLDISLPPTPIFIEADAMRLAQVFTNLLNNAAKYTESGGHIWLAAVAKDNAVVVSVKDTGVGIPADMLSNIFEMFAQVDYTAGRAQGGLGIGLTLARTLVQMHEGSIQARSDGLKNGSEFIVTLPLAATQADSPEFSEYRPVAMLPLRRILVVDDNRDAADSLSTLLQLNGAEVLVVYDGKAALGALESYNPEAVLLDIAMPGMDGCEVARRIRQDPQFRNVTLIALSGWSQEETLRRIGKTEFDGHLVKPVAVSALVSALTSLHGA